MMAKVGPLVVGPVVWLLGYGLMLFIAALYWEISPDRYLGVAFIAYVSSAIAATGALLMVEKISPGFKTSNAYGILAAFALLWMGWGAITEPDAVELVYKGISLTAAQVGIFTAFKFR